MATVAWPVATQTRVLGGAISVKKLIVSCVTVLLVLTAFGGVAGAMPPDTG